MTNLQRIREEKEMSKYRLSQLSGMSISHITNIESGQNDIEDMIFRNIRKLADALGVNYTELID